MKKSNIIVIIILSVVVVALLILCSVLYVKNEYLEEKNENNIQDNNNTSIPTQDNSNSNENSNYISSDEALQVVLKDLKVNRSDIYDLDNELEYKYNNQVYEIDFKYDGFEYDYYVNAKSGEIVKSFKERDY